jgi:DNA adenine methylase
LPDRRREAARLVTPARAVLKWAGGKRQLLPVLRRYYPVTFDRYVEPFAGSAAVFFDLHNAGRLAGSEVILADENRDVVGCYLAIRDQSQAVLRELEKHANAHTRDGSAHYYRVRDELFNPQRIALAAKGPDAAYPAALAAMLIYLNRTGFNGLFRLNARGDYNVPMGRYAKPRIVDAPNLTRVAQALATAQLVWAPFQDVLAGSRPGDFIYLDPPYAPLSRTARFTSYTAHGFSEEDQVRLQHEVVRLARRGCHIVLSNSSAPAIAALYRTAEARQSGLRLHETPARRAINSRASGRGTVVEFVISTVAPR